MAKIKQGTSQKKRPLKKGELPSVQEVIPIKRMDQNDVVKDDDSYLAFLKVSTDSAHKSNSKHSLNLKTSHGSMTMI